MGENCTWSNTSSRWTRWAATTRPCATSRALFWRFGASATCAFCWPGRALSSSRCWRTRATCATALKSSKPARSSACTIRPCWPCARRRNRPWSRRCMAVREGTADAVVSAGSTGALLAGGMLRIGRIRGVERPALAPVIPGRKKPFLLIDCGANVDCQPRYLQQFGLMGSVYMQSVLGVARTRSGPCQHRHGSRKGRQASPARPTQLMSHPDRLYVFKGNCRGARRAHRRFRRGGGRRLRRQPHPEVHRGSWPALMHGHAQGQPACPRRRARSWARC